MKRLRWYFVSSSPGVARERRVSERSRETAHLRSESGGAGRRLWVAPCHLGSVRRSGRCRRSYWLTVLASAKGRFYTDRVYAQTVATATCLYHLGVIYVSSPTVNLWHVTSVACLMRLGSLRGSPLLPCFAAPALRVPARAPVRALARAALLAPRRARSPRRRRRKASPSGRRLPPRRSRAHRSLSSHGARLRLADLKILVLTRFAGHRCEAALHQGRCREGGR